MPDSRNGNPGYRLSPVDHNSNRLRIMDLVLLGAPGSGKGTQADHLQRALGLMHIASGDLFRDHLQRKTELGLRASEYMARGALVPDPITIAMLRERASHPESVKGVLLDGFPRTMEQAIALSEMMETLGRKIDAVLYVDVPDEELVERLSGRLVCRECQVPFHRIANPFRVCPHGRCTGEYLYQRTDDAPETVRARLTTFHRQTEPVIQYYGLINLLVTVPGHGSVDEVKRATLDVIRRLDVDKPSG
jgi:adenylate kinase